MAVRAPLGTSQAAKAIVARSGVSLLADRLEVEAEKVIAERLAPLINENATLRKAIEFKDQRIRQLESELSKTNKE